MTRFQTCRRHPGAGRFMRTCSGCAHDLHAAEYGRKRDSIHTLILKHAQVGPYTIVLSQVFGHPFHTHAVEVRRPATENDYLDLGIAEGSPYLVDSIGSYDPAQGLADLDAITAEYTALQPDVELIAA